MDRLSVVSSENHFSLMIDQPVNMTDADFLIDAVSASTKELERLMYCCKIKSIELFRESLCIRTEDAEDLVEFSVFGSLFLQNLQYAKAANMPSIMNINNRLFFML